MSYALRRESFTFVPRSEPNDFAAAFILPNLVADSNSFVVRNRDRFDRHRDAQPEKDRYTRGDVFRHDIRVQDST